MSEPSVCDVDGCERQVFRRKLCRTHHRHWREKGDESIAPAVDGRTREAKSQEPDWHWMDDHFLELLHLATVSVKLSNDRWMTEKDREDLEQELLIWASYNRHQLEAIETDGLMRTELKRRSWDLLEIKRKYDKLLTSFEELLENAEDIY